MQRLTYPRTIVVPVASDTRNAIVDFYSSPPRSWTFDANAQSVFKLKFFRGNWGTSKLSRWLAKTSLAKFVGGRRPLAPSRDEVRVVLESWPAELRVTMKTVDGVFEVALTYEVTMLGDTQSMSRDDKKKWKAAVEEDAHRLAQRLSNPRERN
jgi:hypothetical protein